MLLLQTRLLKRECGFIFSCQIYSSSFFSLAVPKGTVNESFSVGIMLPPLTISNNRYMLDSYSNKQNERWGGLKTPHHQESQMNTKCSEKWGISLRFLCPLAVKTSKNEFLRTIMKLSYFKICQIHPLTGGSEWVSNI